MGKRTKRDHDRTYEIDQARYFHRLKQILSDPDFQAGWKNLERLWEAEKEAGLRLWEIEKEIFTHPQNIQRLMREGISGDDPVWGPKLKKYKTLREELGGAKKTYADAEANFRQRFKITTLIGPKQGVTLTDLERWDFTSFLAMPGILDDQQPVQIIFPRPPKADEDLLDFSTTLFNKNTLLLAVNIEHPLMALQAAVDGTLRFVLANLPNRKPRRLHLPTVTFRSRVMALKAQGKTRREIANQLLPEMMKSKNPKIQKRALQRVTDALRPAKD